MILNVQQVNQLYKLSCCKIDFMTLRPYIRASLHSTVGKIDFLTLRPCVCVSLRLCF